MPIEAVEMTKYRKKQKKDWNINFIGCLADTTLVILRPGVRLSRTDGVIGLLLRTGAKSNASLRRA